MKSSTLLKSLVGIFLAASLGSFALCSTATAGHREHKAHVHGTAQLGIAFEGGKGEMSYDGAAINIYGFEHTAVTVKDKKTQTDALAKFEKNISQIVQFDPGLKCQFIDSKVGLEQDGGHSDVQGHFKITCAKSPIGSLVKIDFSIFFPTLTKLDVQVIANDTQKEAQKEVQKHVKLEKFPGEFEIK